MQVFEECQPSEVAEIHSDSEEEFFSCEDSEADDLQDAKGCLQETENKTLNSQPTSVPVEPQLPKQPEGPTLASSSAPAASQQMAEKPLVSLKQAPWRHVLLRLKDHFKM